jgi:capsular polysaccharide biosynthesis protein
MELRAYGRLLRRRWLLALIPAIVVLALGLLTYQAPPAFYNAGVRFLVSQPPAEEAATSDEQGYYTWLESEYIVNGIADWVRGNQFGVAVSEELARRGVTAAPGEVSGNLFVDNARSMLTLSLSHGDPDVLAAMMDAAIAVMQAQNGEAIPQLGGQAAVVEQLDEPVVNQVPPGLRSRLDLVLRLGLAIAAGLALAFFVDYVDPTLRAREDVEALGLSVLGEIPSGRK